jgi:replicative DNA helicase
MENRRTAGRPTERKKGLIQEIIKLGGKLPPQSIELEEAVLGAIMLEKNALSDVIEILKPESFYSEANQNIYEAIVELFNEAQPIDLLTVRERLKKKSMLDVVGGLKYLTHLTRNVNSSAHIEFHARIIIEMAIKRELIKVALTIERDAYEDSTDVFELLDQSSASIFKIGEMNIVKDYMPINTVMKEAFDELAARKDHQDGVTGVPSGFTDLDRVTSGFQKTELIIMAARPGMGKTAFMLTLARNAAVTYNKPVAIFSLEMGRVQIVNRLVAIEAEIDGEKMKKGNFSESEWMHLFNNTRKLSEAKIFIDETPALRILELRAKCRRLKEQHKIEMVMVDYLQLMTGEMGRNGSREQEIASISRALKNIAKELEIPVIALSQLSRDVEKRGSTSKRPQLSDLRESGSIEQDADIVMFIHRPEYYPTGTDDDTDNEGKASIIIAKNRSGALEDVELRYIKQYTKFVEPTGFGASFYDNGFKASGGNAEGGTLEVQKFTSKINKRSSSDFFDNPQTDDAVPF